MSDINVSYFIQTKCQLNSFLFSQVPKIPSPPTSSPTSKTGSHNGKRLRSKLIDFLWNHYSLWYYPPPSNVTMFPWPLLRPGKGLRQEEALNPLWPKSPGYIEVSVPTALKDKTGTSPSAELRLSDFQHFWIISIDDKSKKVRTSSIWLSHSSLDK